MPLREFKADGERWRVWDTVPARTEGLGDDFRAGWLTFDNGTERRRLAPVPDAWANMPTERLLLLLRVAHPAGPREPDGDRAVERRTGDRRETERRQGDRRRGLQRPS